jgi:hypothetical protein
MYSLIYIYIHAYSSKHTFFIHICVYIHKCMHIPLYVYMFDVYSPINDHTQAYSLVYAILRVDSHVYVHV